jgi:glycosyltransferase involved in cell wall biosynthesis
MRGGNVLPQVSVIIPTYNRSKLLRLAVESVLAQTYPNVEIIVVDDGSTDDTPSVIAQYAGRATYIRQANAGVSAARNRGFRSASGEYVNFLDDDDLLMPAKLERQVQVLDTRPEIGLVHCGYYCIDGDGNRLRKVCLLPDGTLRELAIIDLMWSGAPLIRRQCLEQVGLFDEKLPWRGQYSEDWDMWLRIAQAGYQFACVQEPLGAYRFMPDSVMANVSKVEDGAFAVLDKVFTDPQLSADVRAVKAQAYGNTHLWVSWSYYASGLWNDARRNLAKALTLLPQLLEHPQELLESIIGHALSVRISDPVKFVTDVLDHLPPCAAGLRRYRARLLANVYVGLALRSYACGDLDEAKHRIVEALALRPALVEHTEDFAKLLGHHAVKLPVDAPVLYVETVLQNLPACAQRLASVRLQILSEVMVACAFEDYYAGRRRTVVPRILRALRLRPSWLRNRGVVSIFLQSLPALMRQAHSKG